MLESPKCSTTAGFPTKISTLFLISDLRTTYLFPSFFLDGALSHLSQCRISRCWYSWRQL